MPKVKIMRATTTTLSRILFYLRNVKLYEKKTTMHKDLGLGSYEKFKDALLFLTSNNLVGSIKSKKSNASEYYFAKENEEKAIKEIRRIAKIKDKEYRDKCKKKS